MPSTVRSGVSRRRFLQSGVLGGVAALGAGARPLHAGAGAASRARNLILCIADGVSASHYGLARAFAGRPLCFEPWLCGAVATASADAFITDSAAAGSALATGHRARNGCVSLDAAGRPRRTLLEAARDSGRGTGLVVTGGLTTATAAVFAAHGPSRKDSLGLARQMAKAGLTLLLSGGRDLLGRPVAEGASESIGDYLRRVGYALPSTAGELAALPPGPVFGQFAPEALVPCIDRPHLAPHEPSLPFMVGQALRTLERNDRGFFLMLEGTQADWAGHQNDAAMLVHELLEFDAAVGVAQAFARGRDDTLVVVLSDHGCGGLVLGNARSEADRRSGLPPESLVAPLRRLSASSVALWERHGIAASPDPATIRRVVASHWGVELNHRQAEEILLAASNPHRDEDCDGLGRVFSRDFTYLGWTTHEHTAEDVPLFAHGPGAPRGSLHLTEVATAMANALGVELE